MWNSNIKRNDSTTYVFVYYTEIEEKDGEDKAGKEPIGNRV